MDISGTQATIEMLEMGPETDQAMLRYQIEYAEAFAFVFSLYSPKTLETAQRLRDKVERAARNHHNIVTMSEYESEGGMGVPVFLIGNRDGDLAPPQGESTLPVPPSSLPPSLSHTQRERLARIYMDDKEEGSANVSGQIWKKETSRRRRSMIVQRQR